jgi:sjoegren syndrome nuclear autoantigen 1
LLVGNNETIRTICQSYLGIEDLCVKRDELQRQILIEEQEKLKLEHDIRLSNEKLSKLNDCLTRKITARTEFDRTINETEAAYMKILESSHTLLNVRFYSCMLTLLLFCMARYSNVKHTHFEQKLTISD